MPTIHLNMMELERYRQGNLKPAFAISCPNQKRIIELAAILVYYAVYLCLHQGGRANNHVVLKDTALALAGSLSSQLLVIIIELLQVVRIRYIARTNTAFAILHDNVDGKSVELE